MGTSKESVLFSKSSTTYNVFIIFITYNMSRTPSDLNKGGVPVDINRRYQAPWFICPL
jgi:hypothetical protein